MITDPVPWSVLVPFGIACIVVGVAFLLWAERHGWTRRD